MALGIIAYPLPSAITVFFGISDEEGTLEYVKINHPEYYDLFSHNVCYTFSKYSGMVIYAIVAAFQVSFVGGISIGAVIKIYCLLHEKKGNFSAKTYEMHRRLIQSLCIQAFVHLSFLAVPTITGFLMVINSFGNIRLVSLTIMPLLSMHHFINHRSFIRMSSFFKHLLTAPFAESYMQYANIHPVEPAPMDEGSKINALGLNVDPSDASITLDDWDFVSTPLETVHEEPNEGSSGTSGNGDQQAARPDSPTLLAKRLESNLRIDKSETMEIIKDGQVETIPRPANITNLAQRVEGKLRKHEDSQEPFKLEPRAMLSGRRTPRPRESPYQDIAFELGGLSIGRDYIPVSDPSNSLRSRFVTERRMGPLRRPKRTLVHHGLLSNRRERLRPYYENPIYYEFNGQRYQMPSYHGYLSRPDTFLSSNSQFLQNSPPSGSRPNIFPDYRGL
uniref:HCO3_cotransp domain-containing protein n=1 Tax=Panagrellus redivivus TaxID=6233 RepID=A0A7E5A0J8_PANRE